MTTTRMLLGLLGLLSAVSARPQSGAEPLLSFSPSPVYSYRFAGPQQTKEESRDALGNIQGSYSVTYPDGGGTLTYSYAHPARPPAFRTLSAGPLGPAGTVIAIGKNSKDNAFLIEMLEQRIDSRDPPKITKTDAVIIEALPGPAEAPITSVSFKGGQSAEKSATGDGGARPNQERVGGSLTRGGFINSKESAFLTDIRQESVESEELDARNPPLVTDEAIIVEASPAEQGVSRAKKRSW